MSNKTQTSKLQDFWDFWPVTKKASFLMLLATNLPREQDMDALRSIAVKFEDISEKNATFHEIVMHYPNFNGIEKFRERNCALTARFNALSADDLGTAMETYATFIDELSDQISADRPNDDFLVNLFQSIVSDSKDISSLSQKLKPGISTLVGKDFKSNVGNYIKLSFC